jgi:putative phosphoribosyl transferase
VRRYLDRRDAGRRLGTRLLKVLDNERVVVVGLPRGGVPVAYEVARILHCPLDVLVVRKVGVPSQRELAMGAIGEDGAVVVENDTVRRLGISDAEFVRVVAEERIELDRRVRAYRQAVRPIALKDKNVVIVDDGLATGATALAACDVARARGATRVIVATPISSAGAMDRIERAAYEVVSLVRTARPFSVGQWYEHFEQTSDQEVINDLIRASRAETPSSDPTSGQL